MSHGSRLCLNAIGSGGRFEVGKGSSGVIASGATGRLLPPFGLIRLAVPTAASGSPHNPLASLAGIGLPGLKGPLAWCFCLLSPSFILQLPTSCSLIPLEKRRRRRRLRLRLQQGSHEDSITMSFTAASLSPLVPSTSLASPVTPSYWIKPLQLSLPTRDGIVSPHHTSMADGPLKHSTVSLPLLKLANCY